MLGLSLGFLVVGVACKGKDEARASGATGEGRCAHCGMKIAPDSPWKTEVVSAGKTAVYDTPRCALFDAVGTSSKVRVQEFYDRTWLDASEVRFVRGSDVLGPMGPDLVPVNPTHVGKFTKDHGGTAVAYADLTKANLEDAK